MVRIKAAEASQEIYQYQMGFSTPWFFPVDYAAWKRSFEADVDGEGRTLFSELTLKAAFDGDELIGFIHYGRTAFGLDEGCDGYCVIRNLYFDRERPDAGKMLLAEAMDAFAGAERVYAFFHYFGMSCFARHGKLFQTHSHVEDLLKQNGFETEHENVYYSSHLTGGGEAEIAIAAQALTKGHQQYMDFLLNGSQVGGCEIHFVDKRTAYLRWIYVNGELTGRGIGSGCMAALKRWLWQQGIERFDTDTARSNTVAQHFYEKNGFTRESITRSFYRSSVVEKK